MSHITQEMSPEERQAKLQEAKLNTERIMKEVERQGYEVAKQTTMAMMAEFRRIEEKERCLRVKFLDWLSDKIAHYGQTWSKKLKTMADNIHSPCAIKLPEKPENKEQKSILSNLFNRAKINKGK
jgi:pimeloyl-CoA synthetase